MVRRLKLLQTLTLNQEQTTPGKITSCICLYGNQIFFSTGNQPALNLFESLKLAVYVKGCLCAWESYVSLNNAKYPSIIISIHQNLQLWQKSYCCPYTAIFVPKRWNIFMLNTQSVANTQNCFYGRNEMAHERNYRQPVTPWPLQVWLPNRKPLICCSDVHSMALFI